MHALFIDCSFSGLTLALQTHGNPALFTYTSATPRSSDILAAELKNVLEKSNAKAMDIIRAVVTVGPGSFTGSRLGLAAVEALKLVNNNLEIIGISTLQALAEQVVQGGQTGPFTLLLNAAGGQVYVQGFDAQGHSHGEAQCLPLAEALAAIPQGHTIAAQTGLFLPVPAIPLDALDPHALLKAAENPAHHLPPQPLYVKNLTYKTNA
jgi:tRNA threonylcarbamoyl adenosine modification protein YeaZ